MSRPIHLLDLVSKEKLERILHVFTEVAGIASIITYADGHPITQPHHFTPFCLNYCRSTQRGWSKCHESDRRGGEESARLKAPYIYTCLNGGLIDCAAPVTVEGHHLATILAGQVLEEPMDPDTAIERAKACKAAGVKAKLNESHRHSFITQRVTQGHSIDRIQKLTGHTSIKSLQRYVDYNDSLRDVQRGQVIAIGVAEGLQKDTVPGKR